jgi:hypothetical protein
MGARASAYSILTCSGFAGRRLRTVAVQRFWGFDLPERFKVPGESAGGGWIMTKARIIVLVLVSLVCSPGDAHTGSGRERGGTVAVKLDFRVTIPSSLRLSYEFNDLTTLRVAAVVGPASPIILDTGDNQVLQFAGGGYQSLSIALPTVAFCNDPAGDCERTVMYTLSAP